MRIAATPPGLDAARERLLAEAERIGVPSRTAVRFAVVLDEHLSNLILHDVTIRPENEIEVALSREEGGSAMVVRDPGHPFDPRTAPTSPRQTPGGCGAQIICGLSDSVNYSSTVSCNELYVWIVDEQI